MSPRRVVALNEHGMRQNICLSLINVVDSLSFCICLCVYNVEIARRVCRCVSMSMHVSIMVRVGRVVVVVGGGWSGGFVLLLLVLVLSFLFVCQTNIMCLMGLCVVVGPGVATSCSRESLRKRGLLIACWFPFASSSAGHVNGPQRMVSGRCSDGMGANRAWSSATVCDMAHKHTHT